VFGVRIEFATLIVDPGIYGDNIAAT